MKVVYLGYLLFEFGVLISCRTGGRRVTLGWPDFRAYSVRPSTNSSIIILVINGSSALHTPRPLRTNHRQDTYSHTAHYLSACAHLSNDPPRRRQHHIATSPVHATAAMVHSLTTRHSPTLSPTKQPVNTAITDQLIHHRRHRCQHTRGMLALPCVELRRGGA